MQTSNDRARAAVARAIRASITRCPKCSYGLGLHTGSPELRELIQCQLTPSQVRAIIAASED